MKKTNDRHFHDETNSEDSPPDSDLREQHCQPPLIETPFSTIQEGHNEPEAADQRMSPVKKRAPRVELLEHQLNMVARDGSVGGSEKRANLRKGTIDLYHSLSPQDSIDSMLAGVMVGITNLTMECIAHANGSSISGEINLRYSMKGVKELAELTEVYDARRGGGRRHVTVGAVNVQQGGQAIVGNVESQKRQKKTKKPQQ